MIVCGGTVESPKLLLLSGIGAGGRARAARDRRRRRPARRRAEPARPPALAGHPPASRPVPPPCRPPAAARPSLRAQPAGPARARHPAALLPPAALPRGHGGPARRLHADGRRHPPASRGTLRLASADPAAPPLIDPAFLACDVDVDALRRRDRAVPRDRRPGRARRVARRELYPGPGVRRARSCATTSAAPRSPTTTRSAPARWASTTGRRRPAAARARGGGAARRRRLGDAVRQLGQHARADDHDRRARRRSRARGARTRRGEPPSPRRSAGRA